MCGLAGFVGFQNNVELAKAANSIQQHRGPDNQSIWSDEYIAFAHQRLSIIDLSESANQPFLKRGLVIIFNGEIYNYRELQEKLARDKGVSFITSCDTEVVLEMYFHYGEKALDYFVGMFAFAIYNEASSALFLARDHFGIKPLFYTEIDSAFAFSSELKTLTGIPGFEKSLNKKAVVSCLNYLWVSGNETMFAGARKLPPAHYLTYDPQCGVKLSKYWDLDETAVVAGLKSEEDYVSYVDKAVQSSIARHMVADVPVSSFLSGGLDSSLIAVLAKGSNSNLSTYTISTSKKDRGIEQMPDDEKFADLVADTYQLDHHKIFINPKIIDELPAMVRTLDEPIGDPAAINTYLICKEARKNGVKVLLSGMGADEIFFGYRRQKATLLAARFNNLPDFLKKTTAGLIRNIPVRLFGKGFKLGRWAKRFIGFATLPTEHAYMRSYSYYDIAGLKGLLKKDFHEAVHAIRKEHKEQFEARFPNDLVNRICHTDIGMFMLGLNLTYTDRASMAASVEVRIPFVDKYMIEAAMHVPGPLKIKGGVSKYILKKAAERHLPNEIVHRQKAAFGAPIRSWVSGDLKEMVDDLLSRKNIERRGILNYQFVQNLIDDDRSGREDYAYQIYQLLTLELWCREYLDK